jgi:glycosyltransferase involved in cell wall biosynthesis
MSPRSLDPLEGPRPQMVVVPVPVAAEELGGAPRDIAAVAYAADPEKRRLSLVLEAWSSARREAEKLVLTGLELAQAPDGVEVVGHLAPADFRALLRRSRTYIAAARREDYGIAALEALACGCQLVTTPSPGPFPALELARRLDPRLVSDDLASAIRTALDDPRPGYGEQAAVLLEPFTPAAVDRTVGDQVLPRLLG